jgi:hypothetical protein
MKTLILILALLMPSVAFARSTKAKKVSPYAYQNYRINHYPYRTYGAYRSGRAVVPYWSFYGSGYRGALGIPGAKGPFLLTPYGLICY